MQYLDCEIVENGSNIDAAVIWLHGLGANGHDFVPIIPELQLPQSLGVRFVFPHAPSIPITINGGMVMPAWYDILAMDMERKIDTEQILASAAAVHALIEREIAAGIAPERIILAGFSQGGAVCYEAALSYKKSLGGLLALSTYFATHKTVALADANRQIPIFVYHGTEDMMVPEAMGKHALAALAEKGYTAEYKTYPMAHAVHPREIADISVCLQQLLA
jgi:phospholipase/carboxylesterase